MPSPTDSTWVEYTPDSQEIVRVWSSEVAALRSAVEHQYRVTRLPYGMTLEEHLAAVAEEPTLVPQRRDRKPKPEAAPE